MEATNFKEYIKLNFFFLDFLHSHIFENYHRA